MDGHYDFLNLQCSPGNLDLFFVRCSILEALRQVLPSFKGRVLDIGCGNMPYKSVILSPPSQAQIYIGMDLKFLGEKSKKDFYVQTPDLYWDGNNIPFRNSSIDCAVCTEVLEHCPYPQLVLQEIQRVLNTGGLLFFTVPFIWPLHDAPYDEYRYTPFALQRLLMEAGFHNIKLKATGGWDASLAQMLGLWVRRRPMSGRKRRLLRPLLSLCLWPLIWLLYRVDKLPAEFRKSSMITGISGTAWKWLPLKAQKV